MNCCPLSEGEDGRAEFFDSRKVKARKPHKCMECRAEIAAGSEYIYAAGKFDGDFFTHKTCLLCNEIFDHFAQKCGGGIFGMLWGDLRDNLFPDMRAGGPCLEGLSADAKAMIFARWRKWKGLDSAEILTEVRVK